MVPCWFVTPCRQEMRGTFVIFLLTAVKNIRKKKRWSGNSWTSKTAQKISQKANLQFLFSIFFSFQPNRKKKHAHSDDVSKIFLGPFSFHLQPFLFLTYSQQRSLSSSFYARPFIFLQQPLHLLLLLLIPLLIHHVPHPSLSLIMYLSGTFFFCISHPFPSSVGISFAPFQILIQNPFLITLLALSPRYFCWVTLYFSFWKSSLL